MDEKVKCNRLRGSESNSNKQKLPFKNLERTVVQMTIVITP